MKFYKTTARCEDCELTFPYAVTEEEMEDGSAADIPCPLCGQAATYEAYVQCTQREYEVAIETYEDYEDLGEDLEDFDDFEIWDEEDWE